jgi:tRNA threonylcarbamoyladenosine biosynthesis protein TsaE
MPSNQVDLQLMEIRCSSITELPEVVRQMLDIMGSKPSTILLRGDLGAGKTTLVQAFCKVLGSGASATSPTFSLINEYPVGEGLIFHIDLYRLKSIEEAVDIGLEEYLYSGNWCFIEWPELIMPILEEPYWELKIKVEKDSERIFRILKFPTDPSI